MYILPIGGLYGTYHLLREPGNSIDPNRFPLPQNYICNISPKNVGGGTLISFRGPAYFQGLR